MVAYGTLVENQDAETRADIDAVIDGLTPPSVIREWEANQANAREVARGGG